MVAGARFPGKERDELEVRHHYRALAEMNRLAAEGKPLTEMQMRRLHGLMMTGESRSTPYRDGQSFIYGLKGIYSLDEYCARQLTGSTRRLSERGHRRLIPGAQLEFQSAATPS